jgi:ABC-type glycerol-3-phosphate transport system permease component
MGTRRPYGEVAALPTVRAVPYSRAVRQVVGTLAALLLLAWTVFPFVWILLTSLKSPGDILSVPPKFVFEPTLDNYAALVPLYLLYQRLGLYNTHAGLIFAYQLITLPFTIWMLRSFFMEIPTEIQEAAKIDGCSWAGVLTRVILPLSLPGIAVTLILGFMFCWNAFNYPLMLAGRQTFPVTVGAIQFISYEQVLWGQMAAATIVAALPQLLLSLMVQKYIVRGLTMGAVR